MATPRSTARPISPHLSAWRPGIHMIVSIVHRITGDGMATVGTVLLVWWLAALAGGANSYARFLHVFAGWAGGALGWLFGIGLTFAFFQHMATGVRHLVLDTGAGYELKRNKRGAMATVIVSVVLTLLYWAWLLGAR